jgi:transposase-like protein
MKTPITHQGDSQNMFQRVREMLQEKAPQMLTGTVEIDETFVTGKDKNRHASKKVRHDWKDNAGMVVGALQRDGKVITKVVKDTKSATLIPFMVANVAPGTEVYTDENVAYQSLGKLYSHGWTVHSKANYVVGRVHTNSIEGHWSQLKRGIVGIYHSVSNKHLQAYCNEFAYRYNTRKTSDSDRFFSVLNNCGNFVLPYKKLIKNDDALGM